MSRQCSCKRGYASEVDSKCAHCRTNRDQRDFERAREAYGTGCIQAKEFPEIDAIANPYRTEPERSAWLKGVRTTQAEASRIP